jgi:hypothetical protein
MPLVNVGRGGAQFLSMPAMLRAQIDAWVDPGATRTESV